MINDSVLALTAVAVIMAAALLASGRWKITDDDVTEATEDLPEESITVAHLDTLRLGVTLRGYRMDEVDVVLDRVAQALRERDARIAELEQRLENEPVLNMDSSE
jgi:DivIVA domain-containing protein